MIREAFDDTAAELQESSMITGIAGKKGFSVITMTKNGMSSELGVIRRVLEILERYHINVEYIPPVSTRYRWWWRQARPRRICTRHWATWRRRSSPTACTSPTVWPWWRPWSRKMAFQPGSSGKIFAKLGETASISA